ncbi:MAG: MFS transporter [Clostridia bacterium]|nr:MFS transporter [Clostridia bacterium]
MKKITNRKLLLLYGCSGIGVNLLGMIMGSYLCSALVASGFESRSELWTFLDKDIVVVLLWGVLNTIVKIFDGVIDIPFAAFFDNLKTRFGRRRPSIVIGLVFTLASYVLFALVTPQNAENSLLNTVWYAFILMVFYASYTLTMLAYYATFSEIVENDKDRAFLSNTKSVCDVVYFSLSFALVPVFVNVVGMNIRYVALLFLPCAATMLIPLFLIKEPSTKDGAVDAVKEERVSLLHSLAYSFKDRNYIFWLCILSVMNFGLQLFLSGINEFFSTTDVDMTFVMASAFAPVPFTLMIYNRLMKKRGLKFAYQYALLMFSIGMSMMFFSRFIPSAFLTPFAVLCGIITSFGIGAFFSVTYMIPSQLASEAVTRDGERGASSMYFAVQGLFEAISAGLATGIVLNSLKLYGGVPILTFVVAAFCMVAFLLAFLMPKSIARLGKQTDGVREKK